jgi:hypothetical protein
VSRLAVQAGHCVVSGGCFYLQSRVCLNCFSSLQEWTETRTTWATDLNRGPGSGINPAAVVSINQPGGGSAATGQGKAAVVHLELDSSMFCELSSYIGQSNRLVDADIDPRYDFTRRVVTTCQDETTRTSVQSPLPVAPDYTTLQPTALTPASFIPGLPSVPAAGGSNGSRGSISSSSSLAPAADKPKTGRGLFLRSMLPALGRKSRARKQVSVNCLLQWHCLRMLACHACCRMRGAACSVCKPQRQDALP